MRGAFVWAGLGVLAAGAGFGAAKGVERLKSGELSEVVLSLAERHSVSIVADVSREGARGGPRVALSSAEPLDRALAEISVKLGREVGKVGEVYFIGQPLSKLAGRTKAVEHTSPFLSPETARRLRELAPQIWQGKEVRLSSLPVDLRAEILRCAFSLFLAGVRLPTWEEFNRWWLTVREHPTMMTGLSPSKPFAFKRLPNGGGVIVWVDGDDKKTITVEIEVLPPRRGYANARLLEAVPGEKVVIEIRYDGRREVWTLPLKGGERWR